LANASRWSLSPRQGFLVCGMFTAGLFVGCCGGGMNNIPVAALGAAVGLLGPVVIVLSSMRANRADVFGTAHVSQSSPPPTTGITGRADLHLVVNAQGIRNVVVRVRDPAVPVSKWPDVGATLPVLIPNGNARRLQVLWDQVRGHHDVAMHSATYSPYPEDEYLDEEAGYDEYADDETPTDTVVIDPVVFDESPEWRPSPPPEQEPVSAVHGAAPAEEPAALSPTPRRPSPRPRRQAQPADSVEAVVPMAPAPPLEPVVDGSEPVVEATPPVSATAESTDPMVPAGGLFVGGEVPPPAAGSPAPPGDGDEAGPDEDEAGPAADEAAEESQPDEQAPDDGRNRYVAAYLADEPETAQPGLNGVHNVSVTLIVADLERSLTFYRDRLGLTEIDTGVGSAVLASGNARILLRQVTDTRPVDRRVVHLNLEVDDVHEAYERLRREGVEFMHPPRVVNQGEQLEQWAATLRDPDGHAIALTRWEVRH
jgi:catechol 2,3-dioxygenase-like lactoylglutathione lyase family enzyme